MEVYARPSRSDIRLSQEEQARIEEETREHFDDIAPKRHTKPQRSEYSSQYIDALHTGGGHDQDVIPEYVEFQRLENDPQALINNGKNGGGEEFVETEYYKDLNHVDKQHHTTGTGFIKMEEANGKFSLTTGSATACHASSKGNPATNDWIPVASDKVPIASDKPNRSDN